MESINRSSCGKRGKLIVSEVDVTNHNLILYRKIKQKNNVCKVGILVIKLSMNGKYIGAYMHAHIIYHARMTLCIYVQGVGGCGGGWLQDSE